MTSKSDNNIPSYQHTASPSGPWTSYPQKPDEPKMLITKDGVTPHKSFFLVVEANAFHDPTSADLSRRHPFFPHKLLGAN